ncbi:MAG: glycosyltransferase family 4 protein [Armatimonadota bacterium]
MLSCRSGGESVRLVHVVTVPESFSFLVPLVRYTTAKGWEVYAISSANDQLAPLAEKLGVLIHTVKMSRRIAPLEDLRALVRLVRIIRALKPDVVHAHTPKGGLLGTMAAFVARVPVVVYHIHGLPLLTACGVRRSVLRACEKISCQLADLVLCVSQSCRDVVVESGVCPAEKIRVPAKGSVSGVDAMIKFNSDRLPEGTRLGVRVKLGIPNDALVIGYVGRIVRDKGIVELTQAWQSLRGMYPELHLMLVGPFESQDPVPPEAERKLRSDPRVHMVGLDWNTPPYYAAMDIAVLPSYREGFGLSALEASAMKLPVVATRIPGCVDAVEDGVTGILVEPRNADELAAALRVYIKDPMRRLNDGHAGRERVLRDFRQEDVCKATFDEYEKLLTRRGFDLAMDGQQGIDGKEVI